MNQDIIIKLIEELQRVLPRPAMYMGKATVAAVQSFGGGLHCAYIALGIPMPLELLRQATRNRGWEFTSTGGVADMREQGLTEEQIVSELLLIEIGMLELVAKDYQGSA